MIWATYGAEQRAFGKRISKVELIRGWHNRKSALPISDAAEMISVTIPQFESVVSILEAHPELTDEEIAGRVNWRKY